MIYDYFKLNYDMKFCFFKHHKKIFVLYGIYTNKILWLLRTQ